MRGLGVLSAGLLSAALCGAGPARAQETGATERLIELLVRKGIMTRGEATDLLAQATREAGGKPRGKAALAARAKGPQAPAEPPAAPGEVRVTYVPQIVRDQIADQVRDQVMSEAKTEGWAQPNVLPEWVQRIRVFGDIRVRGEEDLFQKTTFSNGRPYNGNYPFFPDYGAINTGGGFNINTKTTNSNAPILNDTQNRTRERVRARVGFDATLDTWLTSEIRIATGNDSSPVSTNATFGSNGGNFSKTNIWLDRAYVRGTYVPYLTVNVGRGPNPFWTTDLTYYSDLNFDGISAQGAYRFLDDRAGAFLTAGAFPVFNTDFAFSTTPYPTKASSRDKYLFAVQGGGDWRFADDYAAKLGIGYFNYSNIQGRTSAPCEILLASDVCNTDDSRANFIQFGNTLYGIRQFINDPNNPNLAQPQLFGLASKFGILDVHGRVDLNPFHPVGIAIEGDFAKNLLFDRAAVIARVPVNNYGSSSAKDANGNAIQGPYQGGDTAYSIRVTVGTAEIAKKWDWNVSLAYKYLESDSVLDALTDPDFHLGGTNAKGYVLGGNLGIARNTWLTARWLSANEIAGPPYAVDVLQVDLNARF